MWFLLATVILSNTALAEPPPGNYDEDINLPASQLPPLRVGNTIITVRHPTLQTGIVQDLDGTVYLMTALANGEKKLMRISKKFVVKKLIMYQGWPYILTKKGKLYALNITWRSSFKSKAPGVTWRYIRKIPRAAATGLAFYGLSAFNLWLHGGAPQESITVQPEMMGLTGFVAYYLVDGTATFLFRSRTAPGEGSNFFTKKLASGVKDVVPDKQKNDFRIVERGFRLGRRADLYLSDLAPAYANDSSCIYALTKLSWE
jgi:hypothetical protein